MNWCVEFGMEPDSLIAMPYDWRLYPRMLEERDLYFHKLKYEVWGGGSWCKGDMHSPGGGGAGLLLSLL